jgi:UDP-N-acetylglucosamine 2-epimerase
VVSAHREENIDSDKNFTNLVATLNAIAEKYQMPVIVSTHPRTQKRVDAMGAKFHPLVRLLKPWASRTTTSCSSPPRRCCRTAARSTKSRRS